MSSLVLSHLETNPNVLPAYCRKCFSIVLAVKQKLLLSPILHNALIFFPSSGYGAKQEPLILTAVTKVEEARVPEEKHWTKEFQVRTIEIRA